MGPNPCLFLLFSRGSPTIPRNRVGALHRIGIGRLRQTPRAPDPGPIGSDLMCLDTQYRHVDSTMPTDLFRDPYGNSPRPAVERQRWTRLRCDDVPAEGGFAIRLNPRCADPQVGSALLIGERSCRSRCFVARGVVDGPRPSNDRQWHARRIVRPCRAVCPRRSA